MKFPASSRIAIFFAVSAILCATEIVHSPDPVFSDYPFGQWAAGPESSAIRWELHLLPPQLSVHQRLIERIQAVVPGGELSKRRGRGELVLLVRYEDADGRQWRTGSRINLATIQQAVKSQELTFTLAAFVRPGDYKVSVALLDTQTMEHSFARRTLHVAPLKGDPLPEAWNTLPPVEVLPAVDGPDSWFLPAVKGLLHLPLAGQAGNTEMAWNADTVNDRVFSDPGPRGPAAQIIAYTEKSSVIKRVLSAPPEAPHVDLLINTTPSEWSNSQSATLRRNMSVVIPSLKVLSAVNAKVRPPSAAVIDLMHQRIGFETSNAAALDWNALQKVLSQTNPGIIDARSLSNQASQRTYLAGEVARRARDSGPDRWLIVLSGPLVFAQQEDAPLPEMAPDPRRHIIYMRFSQAFGSGFGAGFGGAILGAGPDIQIAPVRRVHGPMPGLGTVIPPPPGGRGRGREGPMDVFPDDLEHILRPMGAQVVSITTPEEFRKAVASLVQEISAAN